MSFLRRLGCASALLGAPTAPAVAQGVELQLTPFAAGMVPLSDLGPIPVTFPGSGQPITVRGEMAPGFGFGGRLTADRGGWLGVEATAFTVRNELRVVGGSISTGIDAQLLGGSLRAVARTREESGTVFMVSAGIGGLRHGGDAFQHTTEQFDLSGVGGAGLHLVLTEQVTLRFEGELFLYNWSAGPGYAAARQKSVMVSAGLGLRLRR